jgi:hypothetical protein
LDETALLLLLAVDRGCRAVDDDDDWSAKMTDVMINILDHAETLYGQLDTARTVIEEVVKLARRYQRQRDLALMALRDHDSLVHSLPKTQADLLMWLASALADHIDDDPDYLLERLLTAMRWAKDQMEP